MPDLILRSRRVVLPDREAPASVVVRDGEVDALEPYDSKLRADRDVDLADRVLLPGVVDTHVHVNEPGRTEWEGFDTATRAAAAGGITTIVDMPLNSIPPTVTVDALEKKRRAAAGKVHVDVGFWGGAVPGNLGDLLPLHQAGVLGFKCFLVDSGVPEFPPLTVPELEQVLAELAGLDALLIVHAEDAETIRSAPPASGRSYRNFLASRPRAAEDRAISRLVELSRRIGGRVHVLHLSSSDSVGPLAAAQQTGVRITAETCPHYLTLAAEEVPDGATEYKCCPPVREDANRDALWSGLSGGAIASIASDHSPCTPDLKRLEAGDFGLAWGGIASLQLGLPVVWTEAARRGYSLADVVRWMCEGPARLAGLTRKGAIAVGNDADFTVFAPDEEFRVDPARLRHRHQVTPYSGQVLRGVVHGTWLRGEPVDDGRPRGRLLRREPDDD